MFGGEGRVENIKKNFFRMPSPLSSTRTVFIFYFCAYSSAKALTFSGPPREMVFKAL
jgi:hypothetical protein